MKFLKSLPSRGRGLKLFDSSHSESIAVVAPFTGAWIEINLLFSQEETVPVAPFTGAWIEIQTLLALAPPDNVAPFTGAWIEIL